MGTQFNIIGIMGKGLDEIKFAKSKTDIVEIVGRFVTLKREGANYIGKSPFCEERTPSFIVNPVKNIFKCFSSGTGGDVLDFVMRIKGFTYKEALSYLAVEQPAELPTYVAPPPLPTSYLDRSLIFKTTKEYEQNDFAQFLFSKFGIQAVKAIAEYRLGTSKHKFYSKDHPDYLSEPGACIFWYCDSEDRVRSGKVMGYDRETGKRLKKPFDHISWVHKILWSNDYKNEFYKNFNLSVCLFGEHLLRQRPEAEVHIFESEKTAMVASLCYENWLCMAAGSLTNLTYDRCKILAGRTVCLHPDCGAEEKWIAKMAQLSELISAAWAIDRIKDENVPNGYDFCDWIFDNLI